LICIDPERDMLRRSVIFFLIFNRLGSIGGTGAL